MTTAAHWTIPVVETQFWTIRPNYNALLGAETRLITNNKDGAVKDLEIARFSTSVLQEWILKKISYFLRTPTDPSFNPVQVQNKTHHHVLQIITKPTQIISSQLIEDILKVHKGILVWEWLLPIETIETLRKNPYWRMMVLHAIWKTDRYLYLD